MPGHADPTPRVQGSPASLCGDGLRQDQAPETTEDLVVDKVRDMDRFRGKRPRVRYAARTERGAFRERFGAAGGGRPWPAAQPPGDAGCPRAR